MNLLNPWRLAIPSGVLFLTLILLVPLAFAEEIRITTDPSEQQHPKIDGNRIVYDDYRNGNMDIYLFDLMTKSETRITYDPAWQAVAQISGNHVLYVGDKIYLFDLSTMTEEVIAPSAVNPGWPCLGDFFVAWMDSRTQLPCPPCPPIGPCEGEDYDVLLTPTLFIYDLNTSIESPLRDLTDVSYGAPDCYGNLVAWQYETNVCWVGCHEEMPDCSQYAVIFVSNLQTGQHRQITSQESYDPKIYENLVLYVRWEVGSYKLYLYDLSTDQETELPVSGGYPAIYGNRIAYVKQFFLPSGRYSHTCVNYYDLALGREFQAVCAPEIWGQPPDIWGNNIVYTAMYEAGNPDIYMYRIPWDHDGDGLPDDYEVAHQGSMPALNALSGADGALDFDGDGNSNANEYWNGTDPWTREPVGGAGCFYWGEAGMGDGIVSPGDLVELKKVITGGRGNYRGVIPGNGETQELDMDGYISPNDLIILQKMIVQTATPALGSRPVALEVLEAPPASVAVGYTCHLAVGVKNEGASYTPGIGVVFEIVTGQSTGTATLLGGEGRGAGAPTGARYDVSGSIADSGRSRIVLRIDTPGVITIRARIPACGKPGLGRSSPEIVLDPAAVIQAQ